MRICDVTLLLQAISISSMATCASSGDCRYRFVEQPPNAIPCNPYPSGRFTTRCVMEFSTTDGGPLSVAWYSRTQLGSHPQPVLSGFISSILNSKAESTLTVHLQNRTASGSTCGDFTGYFCRVSFHNGTVLSESQEVFLFPPYAITNSLINCNKQSVQSSRVAKCVDPQFVTTELTTPPSSPITTSRSSPMTTILPPTTVPILMETTSTAKLPPTTTSSPSTTTTMFETTPSDATPPTTNLRSLAPMTSPPTQTQDTPTTKLSQDSPTSSSPSSGLPATSSSPRATVPVTTSMDDSLSSLTNSPGPSANAVEMPTNNDPPVFTFGEEILLYSAIGVVIVLIMIVIMLLLCLCLWNRVCKRSRYCTCCSYY